MINTIEVESSIRVATTNNRAVAWEFRPNYEITTKYYILSSFFVKQSKNFKETIIVDHWIHYKT